MSETEALETTLRRTLEAFRGLELKFHCTGGLAASYYGEPRFTQDIDLVVSFEGREGAAEPLIEALASRFLIDRELARRAIGRQDMFHALDLERFIKIDFHVGEAIPGELERSVQRELFPGLMVPVVSVEDAILSKLLWIGKGSEKGRRDAIMMLRGPESIDGVALNQRAVLLGVEDLLADLRQRAYPKGF